MSLANILLNHSTLSLTPSNRIRCSVTGHELPPRAEEVSAYLSSKKYQRALLWQTFSLSLSSLSSYLVPHKDKEKTHLLHCTLTGHNVNKIPEQIMKHIQGKKYLR